MRGKAILVLARGDESATLLPSPQDGGGGTAAWALPEGRTPANAPAAHAAQPCRGSPDGGRAPVRPAPASAFPVKRSVRPGFQPMREPVQSLVGGRCAVVVGRGQRERRPQVDQETPRRGGPPAVARQELANFGRYDFRCGPVPSADQEAVNRCAELPQRTRTARFRLFGPKALRRERLQGSAGGALPCSSVKPVAARRVQPARFKRSSWTWISTRCNAVRLAHGTPNCRTSARRLAAKAFAAVLVWKNLRCCRPLTW